MHMGGYQNYSPFLGPLNTWCRIILRTQKRTIILTPSHMNITHLGLFGSPGMAEVPAQRVQEAPEWALEPPKQRFLGLLVLKAL